MLIKSFKPSIRELAPYIKQAVESGSSVRLTVTGFSMYPLLRGGSDDVVLSKLHTVKKYDVVLFQRENGDYIFHRVIKVKNNILTIAGDNETKREYPVPKEKVIATMTSFVRSGKSHDVSSLWYKAYSRIWLAIFPLRPAIAKVIHNLAKAFRKIKGVLRHKKDK